MMQFGAKLKELFFTSEAVLRAMDRNTRAALSKFGAFVRSTARRSIRKRKKPAPAGSPPSSHVGTLKRHVYFAYEPQRRSVVIGPARLPGARTGGDAPEALEHGGTFRRQVRMHPARRGQQGQAFVGPAANLNVHYEPHPFMGPAYEKELPNAPKLFGEAG